MKIRWIITIILLLLFIGIQFIPNELPENQENSGSELTAILAVSEPVNEILRFSCYDCHSFETNYPWYSRVAPSSWLLVKDIREGREHLNFSIWGEYSIRNQIGKLDEIQHEVEEGRMPLPIYTLVHQRAKLNDEQVTAIVNWTEEAANMILE